MLKVQNYDQTDVSDYRDQYDQTEYKMDSARTVKYE